MKPPSYTSAAGIFKIYATYIITNLILSNIISFHQLNRKWNLFEFKKNVNIFYLSFTKISENCAFMFMKKNFFFLSIKW